MHNRHSNDINTFIIHFIYLYNHNFYITKDECNNPFIPFNKLKHWLICCVVYKKDTTQLFIPCPSLCFIFNNSILYFFNAILNWGWPGGISIQFL